MAINLEADPTYAQLGSAVKRYRHEVAEIHGVPDNQVVPTNGATGALSGIIKAIRLQMVGKKRATALLSHLEYFDAKNLLRDGKFDIREVKKRSGVNYPVRAISEALRDREETPDLFYISNPNNPTGTILSMDELRKILDSVQEETRVVIDRTLTHPGDKVSLAGLQETHGDKHIIIVDSLSKDARTVGRRMGYMVANHPKDLEGVHLFEHATSLGANQSAVALLNDEQRVKKVRKEILQSNTILESWSEQHPHAHAIYHPSQSNFALIELVNGMTGTECKDALFEFDKIRVKSGADIGIDDKYIRIDMGQPSKLREFLRTLDSVLDAELTIWPAQAARTA